MGQNRKNVSPFSNENRKLYVVEHIQAAMLELLEEKELYEISISELCDLAGVGRASFYRNFTSKEDVVKKCVYHKLTKWLNAHPFENTPSTRQFIYELFLQLEQHKDFYGLIYKRKQHEYIKDFILETTRFDPEQDIVPAYSSAYLAFFIYGWIEVWLRRGMKDSAEELAKYLPEK